MGADSIPRLMTEERWETRRKIYKYSLMGMNVPSVIRELSVVDGAFSEREYKRLHIDWARGDGPNGWKAKLANQEKVEDVSNRHLYALRLIQGNSLKIAFDLEANQFARLGAQNTYLNAVELERKIMGIRPPVLPETLTPESMIEAEKRLSADAMFEMLPDKDGLRLRVVQEIFRQSDKLPHPGEDM